MIDTLDQYLSTKHKEIYRRFSKQFNGEYIANNCPHCKSLQGASLTLESMYNLLINAQKNNTLPSCIVETLAVTETSLPKKEWKDIITGVLEFQG